MAQTSWPFENIDTTETQFSQWARNIGEGVIQDVANELEPFADSSGMVVKVKTGQALVRGHYYNNDAEVSLTIATADLTNPRIDAVVLRLDPLDNSILLAVVQGTPDASPVAPALTITDGGVYEQLLATVLVSPATANIAPGDVTDERKLFGGEITGAVTTILNDNLTASRALISNTSGKVAVSATTAIELGHVAGVTSAIQTQLNARVNTVNGAVTTAATNQTVVRNITLSTSDPSGGSDGQIWLKYV